MCSEKYAVNKKNDQNPLNSFIVITLCCSKKLCLTTKCVVTNTKQKQYLFGSHVLALLGGTWPVLGWFDGSADLGGHNVGLVGC